MDVEFFPPRPVRGITLIELITTLAVAGVSMAVAVPTWQSVSTRSAITSAANGMLTDLRYARSTAVTRNRSIGLCPSRDAENCSGDPAAWHEGYLIFVDIDGDRDRADDEPLLRIRAESGNGVRMQTTSGRPVISFRPDGSAWSTNATFSVCLGEHATHFRAVVLYGSGRARVGDRGPGGRDISCG